MVKYKDVANRETYNLEAVFSYCITCGVQVIYGSVGNPVNKKHFIDDRGPYCEECKSKEDK